MATYNFTCSVADLEGFFTSSFSVSASSGAPELLVEGDVVNITFSQLDTTVTATIGGWNSSIWTNTSVLNFTSNGQTLSKTVKAGATTALLDSVNFTPSNGSYPSRVGYFEVLPSVDTTPDTFTLGTDQLGLQPSSIGFAEYVVISGINSATTATITNGEMSINGGAFTTSPTSVNNGNSIQVRFTAPAAYSSNKTVTLNVGGVSDAILVTTPAEPSVLIRAPFTVVPFKLSEVKNFFGGATIYKLSDYYRGGSYVPDVAGNSGIPTAAPMNMTDLLNSVTSFFFTAPPGGKSDGGTTQFSTLNLALQWTVGTDFSYGFGSGMNDAVELRYTFTSANGTSSLVSSTGSPGTWSKSNDWGSVTHTATQGTSGGDNGTITIEARHPEDPTRVLSATVSWSFFYEDGT